MKKNKKKGFTLVELLAVIVILAIILVIAVPKIMETIKDTTKASFESSAKMVAAQVENQYTVAQTLNKSFGNSGDCMQEWAGLNDADYASCTYKIESDGTAKVTLEGKNKFNGLSVCEGTRSSATAIDEVCEIEELGCDTLYWDGNKEGKIAATVPDVINEFPVQIVENVVTWNNLTNGIAFKSAGEEWMYTYDEIKDVYDEMVADSGADKLDVIGIEGIYFVQKDNVYLETRWGTYYFPVAGVYMEDFAADIYVTIHGYTGFPHSENCGH